ncbi:ROK family transcriptional regulator [Streptomyces sp. BI20]|uniref:ROK family transcriptional regulator n=1 Tax=Streptomyces sp. BI20 TaxID=3403460 RepID=UPI003C745BC2
MSRGVPPGATPGTPSVLRAMNDRTALELLLAHGPLTRARIGQLTGLSKPTASQLLARLEAAGLVVADGTSEGGPGPQAQLWALNGAAGHAAALDVSPERTLAAVADLTGRVVGEAELPPADGPIVSHVTAALAAALADAGLDADAPHHLVIATPGAFDPRTGTLRYADHLPGWHSPTLLEEVAAALPMPVSYENDVNLAALAERRRGAAREHPDFVLLWNEAGLGAALVLGDRLHRGWTGGAGEVGFLPVPGHPLERQVARRNTGGYQESAGSQVLPLLAAELGIAVPEVDAPTTEGRQVAAAVALLSDAAADPGGTGGRLLDAYATTLATGLASVVAVLDPELVVLSGAVLAAGGEPLRERLEAELGELSPTRPRIVPGEITHRPVLGGALETALAATREDLFDTSRH